MNDRIAGALLLSMYGDAAGTPQEIAGLRGEIGDPTRDPLPIVDGFREGNPSPWNIWAPGDVTTGMRGVVSDDTATKIVMTEGWISAMPPAALPNDDRGFFAWLTQRPTESAPWRESTAQIQADLWAGMDRTRQTGECPPDDGQPCFYVQGTAVAFGIFLYQSLGLIWSEDAYTLAPGFCSLDQGEAGHAFGLLAGLTGLGTRSEGLITEALQSGIDRWIDTAGPDAPVLAKRVRWLVDEWIPTQSGLDEAAFLANLHTDLYDHPDHRASHDLRPFDPGMQAAQAVALLLYGQGDPARTMRVAANTSGDTDTVAMIVGLILGGFLGYDALMQSPLAEGLRTVEDSTEQLFERTLAQRSKVYSRFTG